MYRLFCHSIVLTLSCPCHVFGNDIYIVVGQGWACCLQQESAAPRDEGLFRMAFRAGRACGRGLRRHVTNTWVMSFMNGTCMHEIFFFLWAVHAKRVVLRMNESRHIQMSHVAHEWGMSRWSGVTATWLKLKNKKTEGIGEVMSERQTKIQRRRESERLTDIQREKERERKR